MQIPGVSNVNAAASIAGVQGANDQVRVLGQGLSSLLAVAEEIADQIPQAASAPVSVDPARGQNLDITV